MSEPNKEDLIRLAKQIKWECEQMIEIAEKLYPDKEWLTTREVAELEGLTPKTVSNYAAIGHYKRIRKVGRRYEIHISELEIL